MKKTVLKARVKPTGATAEHYKDGSHDFIKIGEIRVLVMKDGPWWFAQGLEIDVNGQGKSLEEAKEKFVNSLALTAHAYLEKFGSIRKMLCMAPPEVLEDLVTASNKGLLTISTLSEHELEEKAEPIVGSLRFSGVRFYERREEVRAAL